MTNGGCGAATILIADKCKSGAKSEPKQFSVQSVFRISKHYLHTILIKYGPLTGAQNNMNLAWASAMTS